MNRALVSETLFQKLDAGFAKHDNHNGLEIWILGTNLNEIESNAGMTATEEM